MYLYIKATVLGFEILQTSLSLNLGEKIRLRQRLKNELNFLILKVCYNLILIIIKMASLNDGEKQSKLSLRYNNY